MGADLVPNHFQRSEFMAESTTESEDRSGITSFPRATTENRYEAPDEHLTPARVVPTHSPENEFLKESKRQCELLAKVLDKLCIAPDKCDQAPSSERQEFLRAWRCCQDDISALRHEILKSKVEVLCELGRQSQMSARMQPH